MVAPPRRWSSLALPAAMALVPFEPRAPTLPVGPLHFTVVEGVALLAAAALVSAAASDDRGGALKFALRMAFMAAFATAVSLAEPEDRRRALLALALGGAVAAGLAMAEGMGVRALDPMLGALREMPFNVAGVRRAAAGSEYPNLGAACIAYGLLAAAAAAAARGWVARAALVALPFSLALLYTYSRGALVASAVGLVAAAATAGGRRART